MLYLSLTQCTLSDIYNTTTTKRNMPTRITTHRRLPIKTNHTQLILLLFINLFPQLIQLPQLSPIFLFILLLLNRKHPRQCCQPISKSLLFLHQLINLNLQYLNLLFLLFIHALKLVPFVPYNLIFILVFLLQFYYSLFLLLPCLFF